MADKPPANLDKTDKVEETSTITLPTEKITQLLNQLILQQSSAEGFAPPISVKLDGTNYGLWSQVVEMHLKGRDKWKHITEGPPLPEDPIFQKWCIDDSIVKGWLVNSLEPRLIGNFIRFPTAKDVWDAIATTFFDGNDESLLYDLNKRVAKLKQEGGSVEGYYIKLQTLWREIDFRRPNPMKHSSENIESFNSYIQKNRVFTFLDGLDDRLDNVRADVLQMNPFPTVEQAFARVRREEMRQVVMVKGDEVGNNPMALVSRGYKPAETIYKVGPCGGDGGEVKDMPDTNNITHIDTITVYYDASRIDGIKINYTLAGIKPSYFMLGGTGPLWGTVDASGGGNTGASTGTGSKE